MMHSLARLLLVPILFLGTHTRTPADNNTAETAERDGDGFPTVFNDERDTEAKPMPPRKAAASFRLPEKFHVGVYASEPQVRNPIAMNWDTRGRLWIAENYTYANRQLRFNLALRDRVVVFEDTDGDGGPDRRTVFTDRVQMLTGLQPGDGGVYLMCPPRLLFIPDADGDLTPDGPARTVLDGFTVADANYHNFANGLKWGPDGWLYGRCGQSCPGDIGTPGTPDEQRIALRGGLWRFHPPTGQFEALCHGTTNPWGHDWNEYGEGFFINTVNGHLWHLIPGAHFPRPFTLDPNPHVYETIDTHADHYHFDTGRAWHQSRDGAADEYGGGHAHTGMMIYLGDNWPKEYRGDLFTWNIHGQRANREILKRTGSGYVGSHAPDLLHSGDPFFRGLELSYGPDGAVYAIDWSDTGECHEHTGVHRTSGRIYRVYHGENPEPTAPVNLHELSNRTLVELTDHPNAWYPRTARVVLAERSRNPDRSLDGVIPKLWEFVRGDDPVTASRALFTLHAIEATDRENLLPLLDHPNEHLRANAIRLLTDRWPLDNVFGPIPVTPERLAEIRGEAKILLPILTETAADDPSGLVRLALASTISRLPVEHRSELARALVRRADDADDHNLPLLVWHGLIPVAQAAPQRLLSVAETSRWPRLTRLVTRRFAEEIDEHGSQITALLDRVVRTDDEPQRRAILTGLAEGLRGYRRVEMPDGWDAVTESLATTKDKLIAERVQDLSVLFGDGRALETVRQTVLDQRADINLRRTALETLVENSDEDVATICLELLGDARINAVALRGLAGSDDPKIATALIANYRRFRGPQRPKVIAALVARPAFSGQLLEAINAGKIPREALTAFDVRQIHSHSDTALSERVTQIWGKIRETPVEKRQRIESLRETLTSDHLANADLPAGRLLYERSCAKCHMLFGRGDRVGPDLTGANRTNLDYLLDNIVDPSGVVTREYRMTIVALDDGRVLNGLVLTNTDRVVTLQTQTERLTLPKDEIEEMRQTTLSPMPEGQLDNLTPDQIRDLIAYLMLPTEIEVPTDGE